MRLGGGEGSFKMFWGVILLVEGVCVFLSGGGVFELARLRGWVWGLGWVAGFFLVSCLFWGEFLRLGGGEESFKALRGIILLK